MDNNTVQCIGALLHCVNADSEISSQNALLQYSALRVLMETSTSRLPWTEFNDVCWWLRGRISQPSIRFVEGDPIASPPKRLLGVRSVLVLPNNTTLNSKANLQLHAAASYRFEVSGDAVLGTVVHSKLTNDSRHDSISHLICRRPSDPKLRSLSKCMMQLTPSVEVTTFHVPVFGHDGDCTSWADAIARWHLLRLSVANIQCPASFLDLYYVDSSKAFAHSIEAELRSSGVPIGPIANA